MARGFVARLHDQRSHLAPIPLRAGLAVEAPLRLSEIVAPAFPLEFPPQPVCLKQPFTPAATFNPDGIVPCRGFEDAGRHFEPVPIPRHIIPGPDPATASKR